MPKKLAYLKNLISQANLGSRTCEQIFTHFEKELGVTGLEVPDEVQANKMSQHITNVTAQR